MKLKRSYSDFLNIVQARGLQILLGDSRLDAYHVLAIDGQINFECFIAKDGGADQVDFETNHLPFVTTRISSDPDWDDIQTTKPTNYTTLHSYYKNSVLVMTVLTTYETPARSFVTRVQKTRI